MVVARTGCRSSRDVPGEFEAVLEDPQPGFLDATVISNYASMNSIRTLVYSPESPVVVPPVCDEIEQGADFGHLA